MQFEAWGPWMEGPFARDFRIRNNRFRTSPQAAVVQFVGDPRSVYRSFASTCNHEA
jgi:hypothetical protein